MPGWDGNWGHQWGYGWIGGLIMITTMIVFWGGLITIAVILIRRSGQHGGDGQDRARHILEQRFARGEIDHDEYERRRQVLCAGR